MGVYRYERVMVYVEGIGESYPSEGWRAPKGYSVGKGGLRDLRVIVVQRRDMWKERAWYGLYGKKERKSVLGD